MDLSVAQLYKKVEEQEKELKEAQAQILALFKEIDILSAFVQLYIEGLPKNAMQEFRAQELEKKLR